MRRVYCRFGIPALTDSFTSALTRASSRLSPPVTPLRSALIHVGIFLAWTLLLLVGFLRGGVLAWSVGIVYVLYDSCLQLFVVRQTWPLLRESRGARPAGEPCRVGVIVAAHNEARVLSAMISALRSQHEPPDRIVIADDGSSDLSATLLSARYGLVAPAMGQLSASSAQFPGLFWLRLPHGGKARALNAAILLLDTEVVLTVDADTLLDVGAIAAVRRAFGNEPGLVAATGVITPVCESTLGGRIFEWFQTHEYIRNFLARYAWMQANSLLLVSGAFAGFRRDALLAVGGFDPACLVEDYELIHRMRRYAVDSGRDWRFRVLGDARARTEAPGTIAAFLRQRRRWFGGFLETQYWYRAMVGDRRYGCLGLFMLPVKAFDTLQPLYGLTAFFLLFGYLATGRFDVLIPVAGIVSGKLVLDLAFHAWSVYLYGRWVGNQNGARFGRALGATLIEPLSFQLLRHLGAMLGWIAFLRGRCDWGRPSRFGFTRD